MNNRLLGVLAAFVSLLGVGISGAAPLGTAFTYQGKLASAGQPASGSFDFTFSLYDAASGGSLVGSAQSLSGVSCSNGVFTVSLDFGAGAFSGAARWLEVQVATNGASPLSRLEPRQPLSPSPYALTAATVLNGGLGSTYGSLVSFTNAADQFAGSFSGNGAGLSGVAAATLGGLAQTNFWKVGGNAGVPAAQSFIGNLDNQPLEFKVASTRALRLEYNGGSPNLIGGHPNNGVAPGSYGATIGGGGGGLSGASNSIAANYGTIPGGGGQSIQSGASFSSLGGGYGNQVQTNSVYTTIGGGLNNLVQPDGYGVFIGGGEANAVLTNSLCTTLAGGYNNLAGPKASRVTIAGGTFNQARSNTSYVAIGGGWGNVVSNDVAYATIGGGMANAIGEAAHYSTIGGGSANSIPANTRYATIPGGSGNAAAGQYAFAAGRNAQAIHNGSFVWADSQGAGMASTSSNQFLLQASGGVGINKNNPSVALDVTGTVRADSFSGSGANLVNLNASSFSSGQLPAARLPNLLVTNNQSGVNLNGSFSGSGASLTNLSVAAVGPAGTFSLSPISFGPSSNVSVGNGPRFVQAVDVNADGKVDLVAANFSGNTLSILTNAGNGSFALSATLPTGSSPICVAALDLHLDGNVDLVVANWGSDSLLIYTNSGYNGVYGSNTTLAVGPYPSWVTAADVNGDFKADIVCANFNNSSLSIFTNNGAGKFGSFGSLTVGMMPQCVVGIDISLNGKHALVTADSSANTLSVLTNNGNGFGLSATLSVGAYPMRVLAADLDGNGYQDLVSANMNGNSLSVYTNNRTGGFGFHSTVSGAPGVRGLTLADVNQDGIPDIISANSAANTLSLFTNAGNGALSLSATLDVASSPYYVAAADFNADNKTDLVSANPIPNSLAVFPAAQFLTVSANAVFQGALSATAVSGNGAGLTSLNAASVLGTLNCSGSGLTGLNASQLASGTVPDSRLSTNVALLNAAQTFTGAKTFNGSLTVSGNTALFAPLRLNNSALFLRDGGDLNHGLGWYSTGSFAGANPDGPVLFGCGGGALGTVCGSQLIALMWNNSGNVGIGRSPSANRLEVEGSASKTTSGTWLANSDARIKTDIHSLTNALETLEKVRLVDFRYTDEYRARHPSVEDRRYLNVLAQEFQTVFPHDVKGSGEHLASGEEILQVDPWPLTIYSAASVQELSRKVKQQDAQIEALQQDLAQLKAAVARLAPAKP